MSKRQNQPNLHCVQRERYFKCKTVQNFSWMCVCVRVWVDFGTEHISSGWHTERSVESEILKTIAKKMEAVHKWYPFPRAHLHTDNVPSCIKDIVVHFIVTGKMVSFGGKYLLPTFWFISMMKEFQFAGTFYCTVIALFCYTICLLSCWITWTFIHWNGPVLPTHTILNL